MKIALIVNPNAGRKKATKLLPLVEKRLVSHQIAFDTFVSQYHEHILKITSDLNLTEYDAIVSMGGDGTNFHVINGLLSNFKTEHIPPLGIIPVGSGNSFAKDLNINNFEEAMDAIIDPKPKPVDVCSFSQDEKKFYFVNLTGLGFVTDVAKTADKFKFFKDFSYVIGVLYRTINLKCHYMELEIDGQKFSGENCFVEFCNSRFTGGDMLMAPDAKIDDGFMDIIIAGELSRTSLLATLPKIIVKTRVVNKG
jgi:diacylglycerol kinase (ATP)